METIQKVSDTQLKIVKVIPEQTQESVCSIEDLERVIEQHNQTIQSLTQEIKNEQDIVTRLEERLANENEQVAKIKKIITDAEAIGVTKEAVVEDKPLEEIKEM